MIAGAKPFRRSGEEIIPTFLARTGGQPMITCKTGEQRAAFGVVMSALNAIAKPTKEETLDDRVAAAFMLTDPECFWLELLGCRALTWTELQYLREGKNIRGEVAQK